MMKFSASALPQATRAVNFIQSQLVELAKNCGNTLQDGLVSHSVFMELENKLEKILHETRAACRPPPIKPVKSDFDFIKPLASGAFGTVNLARHKNTRQVFAIKQIKRQDEEERDEVLLERDILTFLDSSFVISMFCSFETKNHMYMVMEYVGGGDIDSLLEYFGCFSVNESRFYIAELVLALEYIHSHGIIHRDLKPNNLLITTTGHIKVADFGLSKLGSVNMAACLTEEDCQRVAREFNDGQIWGTPHFIAPEVYQKTGYGKPVDWWATGIILYNFLYGFTPFKYARAGRVAYHVVHDDIFWPQNSRYELPRCARRFMSLLLDKNCVTRLGTRGASEVKGHSFFQDVDWSNLHNQMAPYVPALKNEEDTSCFQACRPLLSDKCLDDGDNQDELPTDFCYVAFRFKEEYGSPLPLSDRTVKNRDQLSEESEHSEEEEEESEVQTIDGDSETLQSCYFRQYDSTPSPPSQTAEHSEEEEESEVQTIDGDSETLQSCYFRQHDSTLSPPSQTSEHSEEEEESEVQTIDGDSETLQSCYFRQHDSTLSPPSQTSEHSEEEEESEVQTIDGDSETLQSCYFRQHDSTLSPPSQTSEHSEEEEESEVQTIDGDSESLQSCDYSQHDSTPSPPSQNASLVQMVPEQECPTDALPQATRALHFIQSQLVELAEKCGNVLQDGLVSPSFFMELENKLEKILHETRAACRPPPIKPVKSDFKFIKPLARGTFGTVNLARHKNTCQVFAIKQIKRQDEEQRDEVLLERDILTFLDSSFVISMFCSFETKNHMYMVMEYVGGGDMGGLLKHFGCFPVDMSCFYIAELVLALEYIHSHGIIHRDLKPNNLLITTTGHIKVADFGLSKLGSVNMAACLTKEDCQRVAREFNDGQIWGTRHFMAPEVFLQTGYGKPVDWWATGIILYNFLYGFTPFKYARAGRVAYHVVYDDIFWPQNSRYELPRCARRFMSLLLDKNCVMRLGTRGASEVKGHLFFQDVDWSNLHNQMAPYVPALKNEEDTSCFQACLPMLSGKCLDDGDNQDELPTDFCYVAFRFKEEYGSPLPLSDRTVKNRDQLSEESEHSEEEEEESEVQTIDGDSETLQSCYFRQYDSTPSPPSQTPEHSEEEEESEVQTIDGDSETLQSCYFRQYDSTPSPPSQTSEHSEEEEESEVQTIDGDSETLQSCYFRQHDSTPSPPSQTSEHSEEEEESEVQTIDGDSETLQSCYYSLYDSTLSPPSQNASFVQMVPEQECPTDALPQATRALHFIQSQLIELAENCGNVLQDGLVSPSFFMELENKLEKILHETRTACRPPPIVV